MSEVKDNTVLQAEKIMEATKSLESMQGDNHVPPVVPLVNPDVPATPTTPPPATPKGFKLPDGFKEDEYVANTYANHGFKTKSELNDALEKLKKIPDYEKSIGELTQYKTDTNGFIKPANPFIAQMNEAVAKGIDMNLWMKVQAMDVEKMSPQQAQMLFLMEKHKLTPEQASLKLEYEYKLDKASQDLLKLSETKPDDLTDEEVNQLRAIKIAQTNLQIDGNTAKEFLLSFKEKALTPKSDTSKEDNEKRSAQWKPAVENLMKEYKGVEHDFKRKNPKGEEVAGKFNFIPSDSDTKALNNLLNTIVQQPSFQYTEENIALLKTVMQNQFLGANIDKIIGNLIQQIGTEANTEWQMFVSNGGKAPLPANPGGGGGGLTSIVDAVKAARKAVDSN